MSENEYGSPPSNIIDEGVGRDWLRLTQSRFRTYFPHVDNIYSHRSTQNYKRKPLVSHYWDCRLKGRPPGTPKSDDPNKKKRKRTARQRDLCDVKIKITEYFPGYAASAGDESGQSQQQIPLSFAPGVGTQLTSAESLSSVNALLQFSSATAATEPRDNQPFGVLTPNPPLPEGHPGAGGQRFFTIQRVNGNGANGKNDGVSGGHRHTLEESDRVKKNSVQRFLLKQAREKKKSSTTTTVGLRLLVLCLCLLQWLRHLPIIHFFSPLSPGLRSSTFHICFHRFNCHWVYLIINLIDRTRLGQCPTRNPTIPKPPAWPRKLLRTTQGNQT